MIAPNGDNRCLKYTIIIKVMLTMTTINNATVAYILDALLFTLPFIDLMGNCVSLWFTVHFTRHCHSNVLGFTLKIQIKWK